MKIEEAKEYDRIVRAAREMILPLRKRTERVVYQKVVRRGIQSLEEGRL